ncbi:MAG: hypothetical protein R8G66_11800 [Cytophagales bacterium]|nr:hypothetical protein [Cytophagales bacterium]
MSNQEVNMDSGQESKKSRKELEEEELQKKIQMWSQQMTSVQLWKFMNSENFKVAVDKIMQNLSGVRKTILYTYLFDIVLVFVLLGSVVLMGYSKILDSVTVGTLVGAIIGYAFRQVSARLTFRLFILL